MFCSFFLVIYYVYILYILLHNFDYGPMERSQAKSALDKWSNIKELSKCSGSNKVPSRGQSLLLKESWFI